MDLTLKIIVAVWAVVALGALVFIRGAFSKGEIEHE